MVELHRLRGSPLSGRSTFVVFLLISFSVAFFTFSDEPSFPLASSRVKLNIDYNSESIVPPQGYPWQRWSHDSIEGNLIVDMIEHEENVEMCILENGGKHSIKRCELGPHNQVFVVRNGTIWRSQTRMKRMKKVQVHAVKRVSSFEQMLQGALDLAKNLSRIDDRFKQITEGDTPLLLYNGDSVRCFQSQPILTWSMPARKEQCPDSWAVPTYHLWEKWREKTTGEWEEQFKLWKRDYPWEGKRPLAGWRGSPTGLNITKWEDLPRVKLVELSMGNPNLIDAAFTKFYRVWSENKEEMRTKLRFTGRIPEEDFMKYRAIIDIDGNSWSSRFGDLLCFNSVVVKVQPGYVDYFDKELKPWEHYVPVHANMSNLEDVVRYVVSDENADEMQQIVQNANNWCKRKLVGTQLVTDLLWILVSYVELLNKSDTGWQEKWRANKRAHSLPSLQLEAVI